MNYLEWNDIISKNFFKPENAGKHIHFYLTKQDLIKLSRIHFSGVPDEEIWVDFIDAIKYNSREDVEIKIPDSPIKRPLELFASWDKINTPPFIAYLILFIIPLTETYEEHFNATNYYGKVNLFFKKYGILNAYTEENIGTVNFQTISHLWNKLEEWTIIVKNCDLGIFELKKFGNPNWIHVGKPFSQCVLPPSAINKLRELFFEAGLIPDSAYSKEEFRNILVKYGSKMLLLKDGVIDIIRKSDTNELGQSIIEIIKREYSKWSGETHQDEEEGNTQRIKRSYTVAPLFLQFTVNENDGKIIFSFRMYSSNEYPEDLKFDEYENLYERNGWSKTLNISFKDHIELSDDFNKWMARFPKRDIRLFFSAGNYQLSTGYWVETDTLSKTDPMFLLCRKEQNQSIITWGKTFKNGNFREEDFEGLPENYSLFRILNPTASHPDFPLLTLYNEKKIELVEGLKVNFRTFVNDFLPEVEITNSDGNEKVYLQYRNTEEKLPLTQKQSNNNRWLLPYDVLLNVDFYLKVEGQSFSGNEIAYNLVAADKSAIEVDGVNLPKRDSFGRTTDKPLQTYSIGSNVVGGELRRQDIYASLFNGTFEELLVEISSPLYMHSEGNMLLAYLTLKKESTTEEYYRAFEFFYGKYFGQKGASGNFNLTRTKKASLNFYDYLGFLDYDYETRKIIVNPPQLIFIPAVKGRKALLIGGRDSSLVNAIITLAPKHQLQVEIKRQDSSNENMLLPDAIIIKAFGKRTENYGERNIKALADELKISFSKNDFLQVALQLFSADISEYENELLVNNETSQEDYGWARRIFNPDNLSYERNESQTFDKSFSLIEYKLNEYTYYNKLWRDGKCYSTDKNWGKYLALKNAGKQTILFDEKKHKVAIPLELPIPRLLAESIMLLSGLAPSYLIIQSKQYRIYENIPSIFIKNLFKKLKQTPIDFTL